MCKKHIRRLQQKQRSIRNNSMNEIDRVIKNCPYRHTALIGKDMSWKYAICKLYCMPCLAVMDMEKCDTLNELFKEKDDADNG